MQYKMNNTIPITPTIKATPSREVIAGAIQTNPIIIKITPINPQELLVFVNIK